VALREHRVLANSVRLPPVSPGEATIVGRYGLDRVKAVILHPDDYLVLRDVATALGQLDELERNLSEAAIEAREAEDRPRDDQLLERSADIADLLGL
jgi:hypothetical protein